jgi:hypothetical protein
MAVVIEPRHAGAQPLALALQQPPGGGHLHQPTPQRAQLALLLVVGVVDHLAGVLHPVQRGAGLDVHQQGDPRS